VHEAPDEDRVAASVIRVMVGIEEVLHGLCADALHLLEYLGDVRLIRSPISVTGMVLTTISAVVFLIVFLADLFTELVKNPGSGPQKGRLFELFGYRRGSAGLIRMRDESTGGTTICSIR
jgi:hypothetical protein